VAREVESERGLRGNSKFIRDPGVGSTSSIGGRRFTCKEVLRV